MKFILPKIYLRLVMKSILVQDLSVVSNEIYTPKIYLRLVMKSILVQDLSAVSNEIYAPQHRICG